MAESSLKSWWGTRLAPALVDGYKPAEGDHYHSQRNKGGDAYYSGTLESWIVFTPGRKERKKPVPYWRVNLTAEVVNGKPTLKRKRLPIGFTQDELKEEFERLRAMGAKRKGKGAHKAAAKAAPAKPPVGDVAGAIERLEQRSADVKSPSDEVRALKRELRTLRTELAMEQAAHQTTKTLVWGWFETLNQQFSFNPKDKAVITQGLSEIGIHPPYKEVTVTLQVPEEVSLPQVWTQLRSEGYKVKEAGTDVKVNAG